MLRRFSVCLTILLVLSSAAHCADWMARPGTIKHALTLVDGSTLSLDAEIIDKIVASGSPAYFVIRECFDSKSRIVVMTQPSSELRLGQTVDVQGVISTLSDGQRVIVSPTVYGYTDRDGNLLYHGPLIKGPLEPIAWEWKVNLTVSARQMMTMDEEPTPPGEPNTSPPVGATQYSTIADAKLQADGTPVELLCKPITSTGTSYFFIDEDASGNPLKVYCAKSVTTSQRVCRVTGTMQTEGSDRVLTVDASGSGYDPQVFVGSLAVANAGTIAWAKTWADNHTFAEDELTGKIVTRKWDDCLYIEEDDRSSGIRVIKTAHGRNAGERVDVEGVLKTDAVTYERYIDASGVSQNGAGSVSPLGMINRSLGGGDWCYDPNTGQGQRGITGGSGVSNIGLLVRTWGKVTDTGPTWFKIDDGSGVMPRVCYSPGNLTTDDYITVAGISSCEASGTDIVSVILPASADDLAKPTGLVAPSVSDDGSTIAPSSPLHASWSSSDYGISRYRYKITSMDSQQQEAVVLDWTETTSTEAAYTETLTVGLSYYFHVESKTSASDWSPEGTSDGIACRNVVFVKTGCSGAGTSWTDAFGTLEAGLSTVVAGGEVWVAQGTYTVPAAPKTFTLGSGAGLYGGFAGNEAAREQSSPREHETILDGNKLGSVVTIPANAAADTIIDGFTIRNGTGTLVSGSNYYGGGIYCPSGSPVISHNRIIWNYVSSYGGGIYIGGGSPTIVYNYISGNDTPSYGGGVHLANATATLANNVISANGAVRGAGIYCNSGTTSIVNNTIALNDGSQGGGIYCNNSVTITGNILAYNCSGIYQTSATQLPAINYNCLYNVYSDYTNVTLGTGNVLEDPTFARTDYGDLRIQPTSPCRNAGSNSAVQSFPTDVEGRTRILDTTVDIGAYESDGTTYNVPDRVYRVIGTGGSDTNDGSDWDSAHALATVQGAIDKAAQSGGSIWVKGGTYSTPITFAEHLALRPFAYLYGGFTGSGSQRGNYTTLDGTNNGRVLTIRGGYGVNLVDGFTIARGWFRGAGSPFGGGGIYTSNSSPIICNNTLQSNTAGSGSPNYNYGGAIYSYYGSPVISSNFIGGYGKANVAYYGGGIASFYSNAYISGNYIEYNVGVYGGGIESIGSATIVNNFVYSNRADYQGCGISREGSGSATIASNTITYNTSTSSSSTWIGGGGIYVSGYTTDLITLANNIIAYNRDGVYLSTSPFTCTLNQYKNCVYENRGTDGVLRNYVNITNYGTNIGSNPLLDSTLPWRIQSASPCRGAADPSYSPSDDIEGAQRDSAPDIGCYEYR